MLESHGLELSPIPFSYGGPQVEAAFAEKLDVFIASDCDTHILAGLSPCITFRPEQKQWKQDVHRTLRETTSDPVEAARRTVENDGVKAGILFRGELPVMQPSLQATRSVAELESEFLV